MWLYELTLIVAKDMTILITNDMFIMSASLVMTSVTAYVLVGISPTPHPSYDNESSELGRLLQ